MPFVGWIWLPTSTSDPDEETRLISLVDGLDDANGPATDAANGNDDDWPATSCCHLRTRSFARRARLRLTVLRRISLTYLPIRVCCSKQYKSCCYWGPQSWDHFLNPGIQNWGICNPSIPGSQWDYRLVDVNKHSKNYYVVFTAQSPPGEWERESRFLTAHQHKNRPFSAIWGKNRSKWNNQVN